MTKKIVYFILLSLIIHTTDAGQTLTPINQPAFPAIIVQPEDQLVPVGSNATFTLTAQNASSYQWLRDDAVLIGATNNTLTIPHAGIADVARYSCEVFKGREPIPTRAASLMVYTDSTDPKTGLDPIVVYCTPVNTSGSQGICPGSYVGYAYYSKPPGWGWTPITGSTVFTASDTNRNNTKVEFIGYNGDSGCNQTTVTIPNPPFSPQYQFAVYFTNNVPTNAYGITLTGFNP
ncbi:MAG TPA: immunoglobulin domain-containing protein [Verrucomicrobiae bacterium]|jgi:hypothetical protein